jgi:hypothetical protein
MAVANTKSTAVTNADATQPRVQGQTWVQGAQPTVAVATVEVAAADDNDSVYRFVRVPSNARIHRLELMTDAIAGATDYNLGLYKPANVGGGAVAKDATGNTSQDNLFADALDLTVGNTVPVDVLHAQVNIADCEKRLWELLGYTADPFLEYDIAATGITVGTGAGTISLRAEWVV